MFPSCLLHFNVNFACKFWSDSNSTVDAVLCSIFCLSTRVSVIISGSDIHHSITECIFFVAFCKCVSWYSGVCTVELVPSCIITVLVPDIHKIHLLCGVIQMQAPIPQAPLPEAPATASTPPPKHVPVKFTTARAYTPGAVLGKFIPTPGRSVSIQSERSNWTVGFHGLYHEELAAMGFSKIPGARKQLRVLLKVPADAPLPQGLVAAAVGGGEAAAGGGAAVGDGAGVASAVATASAAGLRDGGLGRRGPSLRAGPLARRLGTSARSQGCEGEGGGSGSMLGMISPAKASEKRGGERLTAARVGGEGQGLQPRDGAPGQCNAAAGAAAATAATAAPAAPAAPAAATTPAQFADLGPAAAATADLGPPPSHMAALAPNAAGALWRCSPCMSLMAACSLQ